MRPRLRDEGLGLAGSQHDVEMGPVRLDTRGASAAHRCPQGARCAGPARPEPQGRRQHPRAGDGEDGQVVDVPRWRVVAHMLCNQMLPGQRRRSVITRANWYDRLRSRGDKCLFAISPILNCDGAPGCRPKALLAGQGSGIPVAPELAIVVRGAAVDGQGNLLAVAPR